jgi:hypothetical protein
MPCTGCQNLRFAAALLPVMAGVRFSMNEEEAKTVQEVARATSQGLSTLEKAGAYLSKYIGVPLEQASGILEDKLKYYRWERKIRLLERANKFLEERGINQSIIPVPLKIAIPLLESGSIEDDDDIQDVYACILVNAADASFEIKYNEHI